MFRKKSENGFQCSKIPAFLRSQILSKVYLGLSVEGIGGFHLPARSNVMTDLVNDFVILAFFSRNCRILLFTQVYWHLCRKP